MRFLCRENALTASIYTNLRRRVNFREYRKEDVETTVANSLCSVVVFDDRRPIGIARIVEGGRITFFIKDAVVDPAYQKNQTGNLLVQKLQEYLAGVTYEGAYIGLMSTLGCVPSYKKHGSLERPCGGIGLGMMKSYNPREVRK